MNAYSVFPSSHLLQGICVECAEGVDAARRGRCLSSQAERWVGYFLAPQGKRKQGEIRGGRQATVLLLFTTPHLSHAEASRHTIQQAQRENTFINSFSGSCLRWKNFQQKKSHPKGCKSSQSKVQRLSRHEGKIRENTSYWKKNNPKANQKQPHAFRAGTSGSLSLNQKAEGMAHLNE